MKTTTLAIAAAMAAGTLAHAQEAVQWRVEDGGNGHWYQLEETPLEWEVAREHALQQGGHLATIASSSENAFANTVCLPALDASQTPSSVWLGANALPGSCSSQSGYSWVTGEPWDFTAWHPGEPSVPFECALSFRPFYGLLWNNYVSEEHCPFLIEWSADCNGDGIVDYGQILDGTLADANENGVPDCCDEGVSCDPCPGDVNNDGQVNGADISVLLGFWGLNGKPVAADINKDGTVDGADLAQLLGSWGECP